jgi:hypothetical protein
MENMNFVISQDVPTTDVVVGEPECKPVDASKINVFIDRFSQNTFNNVDAVATFDVVFTVQAVNDDGSCNQYSVIRRIGVDKISLLNSVACVPPVTVVENKKDVQHDSSTDAINAIRVLAGINK